MNAHTVTRRMVGAATAGLLLVACLWAAPSEGATEASRPLLKADAPVGTADGEEPSLTGSWEVTASVPAMGLSFKSLFTFGRDGTLVSSQAYVLPNVLGFPGQYMVYSTAHGTWSQTAKGDYRFTFVTLVHNEFGMFLFSSRVTGTIAVGRGGDTLTGTGNAVDLFGDGTPFFSFDAVLAGTRIALE